MNQFKARLQFDNTLTYERRPIAIDNRTLKAAFIVSRIPLSTAILCFVNASHA